MPISCRNYFHNRIVGSTHEKILPVCMNVMRKDIKWVNEKEQLVIQDVIRMLSEHISVIEKYHYTTGTKLPYYRLSDSSLITIGKLHVL